MASSSLWSGPVFLIIQIVTISIATLFVGCWRGFIHDAKNAAQERDVFSLPHTSDLTHGTPVKNYDSHMCYGQCHNTKDDRSGDRYQRFNIFHWVEVAIGRNVLKQKLRISRLSLAHLFILVPLVSSIVLLYVGLSSPIDEKSLLGQVYDVLLLVFVIGCGFYSLVYAFQPCLPSMTSKPESRTGFPCHSNYATYALSGLFILAWIYSNGHWMFNNMLASACIVTFLSLVRMPNIYACARLLVGLFIYDVFWVLCSGYLPFSWNGESIMKTASSRITSVGIPHAYGKSLPLPIVFRFPSSDIVMGSGDVAIPGLLLICCFGIDMLKKDDEGIHQNSPFTFSSFYQRHWYSHGCMLGYALGLTASIWVSITFSMAQPALLYIVPCMYTSLIFSHWLGRSLDLSDSGSFSDLANRSV